MWPLARVVELVDALTSGANAFTGVGIKVPFRSLKLAKLH